MKTIKLSLLLLLCSLPSFAQVGVGNTDPKATLDVSASNLASPTNADGILIPRIDNFPTTNPTVDQDGMMVFVTGNGTPTKGFYYWDNGATSWITVGNHTEDADWYEGVSTTAPYDINDNIYRQGRVGIGNPNISGNKLLVVDENVSNINGISLVRPLNITNNAGSLRGLSSSLTLNGSGTAGVTGIYSQITGNINDFSYLFRANAININANSNLNLYSGNFGGVSGPGDLYGANISFPVGSNTNTGDKYGYRILIASPLSGTHYGMYSDVRNTNGYAGYFIGKTSFGIGNANRYILPETDGTNGQVMTTDGIGNVTFQDVIGDGDTQNTLDQAYDEGGAGVGKDIMADNGAVTINGTDGLLITGTYGSGNTIDDEITGDGMRMFFNPRKGALRAGFADRGRWDDTNIGDYSFSVGNDTQASGNYAIAFGIESTATGNYSFSTGLDNDANGNYAFASGNNSGAYGDRSFAFGNNIFARGDYSFAFGRSQNATNADYSFAFGEYSNSNAANSVTMGTYLNAESYAETVFGLYNTNYTENSSTAFNANDRLFVVGNGTSNTLRSNALTIYKNGLMNINDAYNMPLTDGTSGQVMTTDGAGNISFQNQTSDADWHEEGTSANPNDINDNIFTQGNVGIGDTTPIAALDINYSGAQVSGMNIDYSQTSSTGGYGQYITAETSSTSAIIGSAVIVQNSNSSSTSIAASLSNTANGDNNIGVSTSVSGSGDNNTGIYATVSGASDENIGGLFTATSGGIVNTGVLATATGGTINWAGHFGIVGNNGSGNVYVNDLLEVASTFRYTDGNETLGYILSTDANGDANWVDPSTVFTNTDNQNLTAASLTGTTLNLGIQNGTGTSIDLGILQDGTGSDNQNIENLSLNGSNMLTIDIENGNSDTVDLSALDQSTAVASNTTAINNHIANDNDTDASNEVITAASLSGTTLQITEASTTTNIDLSALQDGTGSDNQNIENLSLNGSNILTVDIENGNSDTVDLSALDQSTAVASNTTAINNHIANDNDTDASNEVITAATLNGTDLEITEAGNTTTVDLSSLQDGNTQNTLDQAYDEGGLGNGRIINATNGAVRVSGNDGFEVTGTNGAGDPITLSGNGSRMFFNPHKSAFRVGEVRGNFGLFNSNVWDEANVGENSFAAGLNALASGENSVSMGIITRAIGIGSVAIGNSAEASGNYSVALGNNTDASGDTSTALGRSTTASGRLSTAMGHLTEAPSYAETSIGHYNTTYVPVNSTAANNNDRLFSIGNGTSDLARGNALIIYKSGLMNINDQYNMPLIDGINGQVMTTDGTGNVTFQNPTIDTDNQQIDTFSFNTSSNILTLEIQDDGQPAQTVDLSSLQTVNTDNQHIDTFNFNSSTNILTLEIEDDGQVPQTVDLSSLNPTKSIARITMSTAQTETGSGTVKVNFDTVDFDTNGNFNTTTDRFTVPTTGLYRVTSQITMDDNTGTGQFAVRIRVNGTQERRQEFNHHGNGQVVRQVTSIINLTAGQTLDVSFSRPAAGATILANGRGTFFEIEQL
ncbi:beta strand repeat-containing protein [Psychroserpens algicola]|uniref:beta strand repeat-containing protein n=1 Tax=Psychroserpens algicola TaxID=1719034 RepID=UPI001952BB3E|nr:hypothetical protein [Psychroserpens algicola]